MQKRLYVSARAKLGLALGVSSLTSIGLYVVGVRSNNDAIFWYLPWNLMLAWIPFLLSWHLERVLARRLWSNWYSVLVTVLWVSFLPNAFYLVSDFIHIQEAGKGDLVYDVVLFSSFVFNGVILGYLSLYTIHWQLIKRVTARSAAMAIASLLFICSFAIYIGRDLRWNSWDVLINPASLLFDVSERFIHIHDHPQVYTITLSFFVLLGSLYLVLWQAARIARQQK
jgi:uncharacterized membrane protein